MTNNVTNNYNYYDRPPSIFQIPEEDKLTERDKKMYNNARRGWRPEEMPEEIDHGPLHYKLWRAANPSPRCCSQGCLAPAPALAPLLARSRRSRRLPQEACILCAGFRAAANFDFFTANFTSSCCRSFPSNVHTVPSLDQKETRGIMHSR